jgi:hypothetical protein
VTYHYTHLDSILFKYIIMILLFYDFLLYLFIYYNLLPYILLLILYKCMTCVNF